MLRIVLSLVLVLWPTIAIADDAVSKDAKSVFMEAVFSLLATLIVVFLIPYLRSKAKHAAEEARVAKIEAEENHVARKAFIVARLREFMLDAAASIAEREFPLIADRIKHGQLASVEKVKSELHKLGVKLRDAAIEHFRTQGINLIEEIGDETLDWMIQSVANKVSPFPGRDTARTFLIEGVSDWIIDHGVAWVREHYEMENGHNNTDTDA